MQIILPLNISSPNTPGLRDLQKKENIIKLISRLPAKTKTTFIKISPDINDRELDDICNIAVRFCKDRWINPN